MEIPLDVKWSPCSEMIIENMLRIIPIRIFRHAGFTMVHDEVLLITNWILSKTRITCFWRSSYSFVCFLVFFSLLGCVLALGLVLICYHTSSEVVTSSCCLAAELGCTRKCITELAGRKAFSRVDLNI